MAGSQGEEGAAGASAAAIGFADGLARHGEAVALIGADGTRLSFAALATAADAVPLPPQPTLAMLAIRPDIASITTYLALLRRRHPVILVDDANSLVGRTVRDLYRPWQPGQDWPQPGSSPSSRPACHPDLALLLATSGSTGSPRLVRLSRAAIAANAASIADYMAIAPDDRAITSLPLHYSYGLSVLHSHLAAGAATILTGASLTDPAFWALFEGEGATKLAGVPHSFALMERIGLRDRALPSLRTLSQAGGRLPPALVTAYAEWAAARGVRFFVMYGQTEACARMAFLPPALAAAHPDCIGQAIPGGRISLRGTDGGDAGDGPGEIIYHGPNIMMGYADGPADLAAPAGLSELATGDLAERTPAGLLRIIGRRARLSKLFGLRISHDAVERLLEADGLTVVATGLASGDEERLGVLVEGPLPADLAARLAARHGVPAAAFVLASTAELPRLPSGKPDPAAARRLLMAAAAEAAAAASAAALADRSVAGVFAAAFPGISIGPADSFASLGGDSLNHISFALALEDVIGALPPDWHLLPMAELAARAGRPAGPGGLRRIGSDIALRALAITAIVAMHTGIGNRAEIMSGLSGGALALMILLGYNLGRFQLGRLLDGDGGGMLRDFLLRVLLPCYALILAHGLATGGLDPAALLLVAGWQGRAGNLLEPLWFIEVATQVMLLLALAFAVPAVRRLAGRTPVPLGWALVGAALLLQLAGGLLHDQAHTLHRTLDANLPWVALGWLAAMAPPRAQRLALVVLGTGLALADWGMASSRPVWAAATLGCLVAVPQLPVPRPVAGLLALIARTSFMIYLTHGVVIHLLEVRLGLHQPLISLGAGLLAGVAAAQALEWLIARGRAGRTGAAEMPV